MDMLNSLQTRLASVATDSGNCQSTSGTRNDGSGSDFGTMVRRKQTETRDSGSSGSDSGDRETVKADKGADNGGAEMEKVTETTDEQLVMAVGLMMQVRPEIQYVDATPETAVEAVPDTAAESVTAAPVQAQEAITAMPSDARETVTVTATGSAAPVTARTDDAVETDRGSETRDALSAREDVIGPAEDRTVAEPVTSRTAEEEPETGAETFTFTEDDDTGELTADVTDTSLFGQVQAAPVKVAETVAEPVEVETAEGREKLADQILDAVDVGENRVEISLSPASLGKMTVEITRTDSGGLSVVLTAANSKTAEILERHAGNLQELVAAGSKSQVRVEVQSTQSGSSQRFMNPDANENARDQQRQGGDGRRRRDNKSDEDFLQKLRLGLAAV